MTIQSKQPSDIRQAVPPVERPSAKAHVIKTDAEAIAVAEKLAAEFAKEASKRDRERIWPKEELNAFSQSGLWSINVPKAYGGPELSYVTLSKVIASKSRVKGGPPKSRISGKTKSKTG